MNSILLEQKIIESKLSKKVIAKKIGITRQSLYNKINGKREFNSSEIKKLCEIIDLSSKEKDDIFFADYVDKKSTKDI